MNELEKYKDKKAYERADNYNESALTFKKGFDAAIELDLPVKFYKWRKRLTDNKMRNMLGSKCVRYSEENELEQLLYQYWIENVYKPE